MLVHLLSNLDFAPSALVGNSGIEPEQQALTPVGALPAAA